LYSDRARQSELEGRPVSPTLAALLGRLLHPRFLPIVLCRMSRAAMLRRIPALPQLLTYLNIVLFGLEVTPRCEIGPDFFPAPFGHRSRGLAHRPQRHHPPGRNPGCEEDGLRV